MLYRNFGKGEIRREVCNQQALTPPPRIHTDVTNATRPNWNGGLITIISTTSNLKKVSHEAEVNQILLEEKITEILKRQVDFANAELFKNFTLRLLIDNEVEV